jgi:hypothetical protein
MDTEFDDNGFSYSFWLEQHRIMKEVQLWMDRCSILYVELEEARALTEFQAKRAELALAHDTQACEALENTKSKLEITINVIEKLLENINYFEEERCEFCRGHIRYSLNKSWGYTDEFPENHNDDCPIKMARE